MNRDDIFRMAREAGMQGMLTDVVTTLEELAHFAALVAAAEREACAEYVAQSFENELVSGKDAAAAILARGEP